MVDTSTSYMGISLKNPIVVAACSLSGMINNIKKMEEAGAGALVIRSLFEEQIIHEMQKFEEELMVGAESFAESLSYFPVAEHAGPREHLMWIEKTRAAVTMPLIGSINAISPGNWVDYAKQMAETGIDALELNVYAVEADLKKLSTEVENNLYEIVEKVKSVTKLPVAVKLSPFYSSIANVIKELDKRGVNAVVLFNRFLQPDIDTDKEAIRNEMTLTASQEMRLPLRWIALLYGKINADLAATTGIYTANDVVKFLLAGASVVQTASALYKHGIGHISTLVQGLEAWMDKKGYESIRDFKGKVSKSTGTDDLFAFERAQYVDFLLRQKA